VVAVVAARFQDRSSLMPNPNGINGLGSDRVPYGQAKRMKELAGEAPMSGAPLANPAIDAPRQAQRQSARRPAAAPPEQPAPPPPPQVSPQAFAAQAWGQIAAIPGASPLVQSYAARAAQGGT
jgi:hypothetical protein